MTQTGELIGTYAVQSAIHSIDSFTSETLQRQPLRQVAVCCASQLLMVDVPQSTF